MTRRAELEELPLREELDALARSYHHLHNQVEPRGRRALSQS